MSYYQSEQTLKYNWNQVVNAFWNRYPNPYSKHVLTEDVVDRHVDKDGRLFTKKLLSKTNSAPKWTERFLPAKFVYIIEESVLDAKTKTLVTYTRNIGLQHLMSLEEKVVYRPHHNTNSWTMFERKAWINSTLYGLSSAIQRFGVERYKQNIKKAHKGFNYTLESIYGKQKVRNDIQPFNPIQQRLKEQASKASEYAKSKVPLVIAAENNQDKSV